MDEAEEKQAALAKERGKKSTRRKTAFSVPEEMLPEQDSTLLDGVAEVTRRPDIVPAEIESLPGNSSPAPQPEDVHRKKRPQGRKRRTRRGYREAAKLDQPSGPPSDNVDLTTEQNDTEAASSKFSGDGPNSPKREVVDLTIKEESRPGTPVPPPQASESNEGTASLRAGWVRFPAVFILDTL